MLGETELAARRRAPIHNRAILASEPVLARSFGEWNGNAGARPAMRGDCLQRPPVE
jgi:hypothetical protein